MSDKNSSENLENLENLENGEAAAEELAKAEIIEEEETEETEEIEISEADGAESVPKEQYDALNDKYVRLYAEYENFRKRTAKEKEEIYSGAAADVLGSIFPVLDNFERALQFAGDSGDAQKILEGLKMIESQFLGALAKIGVEEVAAAGEEFNPELHDAVAVESDEGRPDNTIAAVLQKGYKKGGKILRPAMVKVVKN
jgi:molecular chaperone GrpE